MAKVTKIDDWLADWRKRPAQTVPAVCAILNISRAHAYAAIASGKIPSFKVGDAIRVRTRDIVRIIDGDGTKEAA